MKNLIVKTNADTQIWVCKGNQVIIFSEYDLDKLGLVPDKKTVKTFGNFDEIVDNNSGKDLEIYNLDELSQASISFEYEYVFKK